MAGSVTCWDRLGRYKAASKALAALRVAQNRMGPSVGYEAAAKRLGCTEKGNGHAKRFLVAWHATGCPAHISPKRKQPSVHGKRTAAQSDTVRAMPSVLFFLTPEWRNLRYQALKRSHGKCECCGRSPAAHGIALHVDHVKPRSKHPKLALELSNLQVLCETCNLGKGNQDSTDWRA